MGGMAGQTWKRKELEDASLDDAPGITGEDWEGDLSGVETEPDEPMEVDGSQQTVTARCHVNTVPAGCRLTATSRFTNRVS